MSGGIFISYRREDSAGFARLIYDRIVNRIDRSRVFFDVDNIEPGLDFEAILSERVGNCDALVAIIGRHWTSVVDEARARRLDNPKDFVRIEIAAALQRGVRVIPVLVDGAKMPRTEELPEELQGLSKRQAIEISHTRFDSDADHLTRWLYRVEEQRVARIEAEKEAQSERRDGDENERKQRKEVQAAVEDKPGGVAAAQRDVSLSNPAIGKTARGSGANRSSRLVLLGSLAALAGVSSIVALELRPWTGLQPQQNPQPARSIVMSATSPLQDDPHPPQPRLSDTPATEPSQTEPAAPLPAPTVKPPPSAVDSKSSATEPTPATSTRPLPGASEAPTREQELASRLAAAEAEGKRLADELARREGGLAAAAEARNGVGPPTANVTNPTQALRTDSGAAAAQTQAAVGRSTDTTGERSNLADTASPHEDATKRDVQAVPDVGHDRARDNSLQVSVATPGTFPPEPAPTAVDAYLLVTPILVELRRVGCYSGADGDWNSPSIKAGIAKFAQSARLGVTPVFPDAALLDTLRVQRDRLCPLECAQTEVASNGRCVAKTCAKGEILMQDGACKAAAPAPRIAAPRKDPPSSSSNRGTCFVFNGKQYCQ